MQDKRVLYMTPEGTLSIVIPAPGATVEQVLKAVPAGASYEIVDATAVPADRTFRNAWLHDTTPAPQKVGVDMVKAKDITHGKRREKRAVEFAPHDEVIMKQILGKSAQAAEAARAAIRQKYDTMQVQIDAADTPEQLKAIIDTEGL